MPAAPPDLFRFLSGETHVALAVSGGSDSIALLRLAHRHASGSASPTFSVLTVDHGLRPAAADEARQVSAWSRALGLEHHILHWSGPKPASGIQAKARAARYGLMADWCRAHGASCLLTGHTLDDQAETVLMRLNRTSSFDSLAGIPAEGHWDGLRVLRPLLGQRRDALRRWLTELEQPWIDDPSNEDPRFERVRLRALLPDLASSGITSDRLVALAQDCAALAADLSAAADQWISELLACQPGYGVFPLQAFNVLPVEIRVRVLNRLIGHYGGGSHPERAELQRLAQALMTSQARRTLGGAVIWPRRGLVHVGREAGRICPDPVTVPESGQVLWDRRYVVSAAPGTQVLPRAQVPGYRSTSAAPAIFQQAEPVVLGVGGDMARFEVLFLDMNSP